KGPDPCPSGGAQSPGHPFEKRAAAEGRAKLLDVSEYVKPGNDGRWDHLVQAYRHFYSLIEGRPIPVWFIEKVKRAYYRQVAGGFSVSDFGRRFFPFIKKRESKSEKGCGSG